MKLLKELSMRAGNLDYRLQDEFEFHKSRINDSELKHIGDIDDVKVMRHINSKSEYVDFLIRDNEKIGFSSGINNNPLEMNQWFLNSEERRKDLGYKYLYFLKNTLGHSVLLGNIHSDATQHFLQKQHNLKRFDFKWINTRTGEKESFDLDHYNHSRPTEWQVIIEGDHKSYQVFYQFISESETLGYNSIKMSYEWLFDGLEEKFRKE